MSLKDFDPYSYFHNGQTHAAKRAKVAKGKSQSLAGLATLAGNVILFPIQNKTRNRNKNDVRNIKQ